MVSANAMFGRSLLSVLFILSLLSILPDAQATKAVILFPLYIYPGTNAVAWNPLFTQIAAYPSVQFQVIVNPASGPGTTQDPNYIYGIQKLNSYVNVLIYGYVDTSFGTYSAARIEQDLDLWKNYGANAPSGIFFDDVSENNAAATSIMQQVTNYAINTDGFQRSQIVFNCGTLPGPAGKPLYASASQVVIYENVYSSDTSIVASSGAYQNQITVLFYSGSTTPSVVTQEVNTWCGKVDSMFITDRALTSTSNPYTAFGAQLGAFVSAMNACPY